MTRSEKVIVERSSSYLSVSSQAPTPRLFWLNVVSLGGCSRARRKVQVKASQQLLDWVRNRISSWPSRVCPLAAGDLNSGVGKFRDGTHAEGPSVGDSHLSTQNEAGDNFVEMAMSLELGILNTMWRTGGPTYCGLAGYRSTIDYILAPLSGLECVKKVVTCWKLGRRVQLIPAAHPPDHLPVLVLVALRIRRTGLDQQRAHRWDFDRMAIALQQGSAERVAFLKEVDQNLSDQAEQMEEAMAGTIGGGFVETLGSGDCVCGQKVFFTYEGVAHH